MSQPITASIRVQVPKKGEQLPRERPERLHLYVDETEFTAEDGRQLRGVGVLSVPEPVERALIGRALDRLSSDPDRNERHDKRTLRDGHFHASFDSKNGHSHLADQVRACVHGNFVAAFTERGTRSEEEAYRTGVMRALLTTLKGRTPVLCTFEQWGNFRKVQADELIDHMNEGLTLSTYETTMLRAVYPRIEVVVDDKNNPGLQVADLLLWSFVQERFNPSKTKAHWAARCGLFRWADVPIPEAKFQWSRCTVNDGKPVETYEQDDLKPYPVRPEGIGETAYADSSAVAERTVRRYAAGPLSDHVEHLRPGLLRALAGLQDPASVGPEQIQEVAKQFLRLFDTVPVYDGMNDDDPMWLPLVRAKHFLSLTLRELLLYGGIADFFAEERRNYIRQYPSALGLPG
jgi:hypothetical protein